MNKLRKFAASIGITFVAFSPLLFASPVYAQTLEEAQAALAAGQLELSDAISDKTTADEAVLSASDRLQAASLDVIKAQLDYDTLLISDPTWEHPTQQVEHTRQVETVVQVPHTTTVVVPEGLTAECYNRQGYNNAPPLPTINELPVSTETVANIDFQWGGGNVLNCGLSEDVLVKFTGSISAPTTGDYQFYAPGDDGVIVEINGTRIISDWYDKGGGGSVSEPVHFTAGVPQSVTVWFYENGGGANVWMYWQPTNGSMTITPASAFGETTITETTFTEETIITTETFFTTELVPGAVAPLINDPILLAILENKELEKNNEKKNFDEAVAAQAVAADRVSAAQLAIPVLEQAVVDATPVEPEKPVTPPVEPVEPPVEPTPVPPVVEPLPPVVEPVSPEPPKEPDITSVPLSEINPQELTTEQVTQLQEAAYETLATAEAGSPEYEEALQQLWVAAEADDIVVDEALAAVPVIGALATGVADAINFVGNVGADMSPKVREESKKVVVSAVVAVGAAVSSATGAATAAASSVSSRKIN